MHEIPLQRVAAIHDLSGFGRASLTVVIPILASMGVQTRRSCLPRPPAWRASPFMT